MFTPELGLQIAGRLDSVYQAIQNRYPHSPYVAAPWEEGFCTPWSRMAHPILKNFLGRSAIVRHVVCLPSFEAIDEHGLEPTYHEYVAAWLTDDTVVTIDGTWQQFLHPAKREAAPRMLIAPADNIDSVASFYGADPAITYQWQPQRYGADVFRLSE